MQGTQYSINVFFKNNLEVKQLTPCCLVLSICNQGFLRHGTPASARFPALPHHPLQMVIPSPPIIENRTESEQKFAILTDSTASPLPLILIPPPTKSCQRENADNCSRTTNALNPVMCSLVQMA